LKDIPKENKGRKEKEKQDELKENTF